MSFTRCTALVGPIAVALASACGGAAPTPTSPAMTKLPIVRLRLDAASDGTFEHKPTHSFATYGTARAWRQITEVVARCLAQDTSAPMEPWQKTAERFGVQTDASGTISLVEQQGHYWPRSVDDCVGIGVARAKIAIADHPGIQSSATFMVWPEPPGTTPDPTGRTPLELLSDEALVAITTLTTPPDPEASNIDRVIATVRRKFRRCLTAEGVDTVAKVVIKTRLTLATDGSVARAEVAFTDASPRLTECIRATFDPLKFDPPAPGAEPFVVPVVLEGYAPIAPAPTSSAATK